MNTSLLRVVLLSSAVAYPTLPSIGPVFGVSAASPEGPCPPAVVETGRAALMPFYGDRLVEFRKRHGLQHISAEHLTVLDSRREGQICTRLNAMFAPTVYARVYNGRTYYEAKGLLIASFARVGDARPSAKPHVLVFDKEYHLLAGISP